MASGWSCQFTGTHADIKEWCMKLNHPCEPGCKGCIIYGEVAFSKPNIDEEQKKKMKNRSDNPLGER
jgi:hypothetical protein